MHALANEKEPGPTSKIHPKQNSNEKDELPIPHNEPNYKPVEGCSCIYCCQHRFQEKKIIRVTKEENDIVEEENQDPAATETIEQHVENKKRKAEWGQIMLIEDQYSSSGSDESDEARELQETMQSQSLF